MDRAGDAGAVLEVADEGPGVPADQAPRLFDRFYRIPGTGHSGASEQQNGSAEGSGSGLGLAIAAAIVEAHRGQLELISVPGEGARFRVLLPSR